MKLISLVLVLAAAAASTAAVGASASAAPAEDGVALDAAFSAHVLTAARGAVPSARLLTTERLAQSYGSDMRRILGKARRVEDLGRDFGHGLSEAELGWLIEREWAATTEDVLWRRSKLGLVMTPAETQEIAAYLASITQGSRFLAAAAAAPAGRTAYR